MTKPSVFRNEAEDWAPQDCSGQLPSVSSRMTLRCDDCLSLGLIGVAAILKGTQGSVMLRGASCQQIS